MNTTTFKRSLTPRLLAMLEEAAAKPGWWRDVLEDKELIIALRGTSVNVYWKGQSIFKVAAGPAGLRASTHEKFLLDPKLGGQIAFDGTSFDVSQLRARAFLARYEGKASLSRIKRAAGGYSGEEKRGCHWIAIANPDVIDVEIALPGTVERDEPGDVIVAPRIDLLTLEAAGEGAARLVFWEAKAFKNSELGSSVSTLTNQPPVLSQISVYRSRLQDYRTELEGDYTRLCRDLDIIRSAAGQAVSPLVKDVATGARKLTLSTVPEVNLLVFGFDASQKMHPSWQAYSASLSESLRNNGARLRAVGDPKGKRL